MGIVFVWEDRYSVGDAEIDRQHRLMFELANSLPEDLDRELADCAIMSLFKHAREHFALEEEMMRRLGYPKLGHHVELHNDLILNLNEVSLRRFDSSEALLTFKRFIYEWVIDHIIHQDQDFFRFAQQTCACDG
jgi:hemerythrin